MANVPTVAAIVAEAKLAASEFDGPIRVGAAVQQPSTALVQSLIDMGDKQSEILEAAEQQILAHPAFDAALAQLRIATKNLHETAQVMTNATAIVNKVNSLLGHGTGAVSAIQKVFKTKV